MILDAPFSFSSAYLNRFFLHLSLPVRARIKFGKPQINFREIVYVLLIFRNSVKSDTY
jgi:hypothetical protein